MDLQRHVRAWLVRSSMGTERGRQSLVLAQAVKRVREAKLHIGAMDMQRHVRAWLVRSSMRGDENSAGYTSFAEALKAADHEAAACLVRPT